MFCDIEQPRRQPLRGRPPPGAQAQPRQGARAGLLVLCSPRRWSSSTSPTATRGSPVPLDNGWLLRPHDRRRGQRPAQAHAAHAREHGHPGGVLLPRGRTEPARDRPALHRRTHDGRQRHDVPPGGEGDRRRARACRHVHAQAARGRAGLGHAHPHVAVRGRRERLPRPRRPLRAVEGGARASSPACCTTPPRSPP